MATARFIYVLIVLASFSITSCKKEDHPGTTSCDKNQLPIVMAHGLLASGDTYANQFMRFTANGFCAERLFVFDWNTLVNDGTDTTKLRLFIDSVLTVTKAEKVILAGHSAGGGLGYRFCSDSNRAAKVAKYIHIGSQPQTNAAANGGIPTLNIWSPGDKVVAGADIPNATNAQLVDKDHYEVATCAEAFSAMYKFITDKDPATTALVPNSERKISGKVLQLGENKPMVGATVKVYEVDIATGERKTSAPEHTLTSREGGFWGPIDAKAGAYYEFETITTVANDRIVHYYREPFIRSNPLVYLRTLPSAGTLAGNLLASIPKDDNQTTPIIFSANKAAIAGRDVLKINGTEITTTTFASAAITTIAFFLYDGNNNQTTDFTAMGLFASFPFLEAIDMFFSSSAASNISLEFNGRPLRMKNWKSATEGVGVAVFD